jgi:hypothetical protein
MKVKLLLFTLALAGVSLYLSSCDKDEPEVTKIFGTVTIDNASLWSTWADSGEVQLTVFPKFTLDPLAGWGSVPDNFFGPNVPGGTFAVGAPYNSQNPLVIKYVPGKTTYSYELEVEPGTYSAVALGFRHNRIVDATKKTATLGVYWNNPTTVSHGVVIKVKTPGGIIPVYNYPPPVSFDVAAGEKKELNFKADFNFVKSWYK